MPAPLKLEPEHKPFSGVHWGDDGERKSGKKEERFPSSFMKDDLLEKQLLAAYEEYADPIFRHCFFKTSSREVAQDLMQDTFVKAWVYMQTEESILNMKALLYRISNNLIVDWYRKRKSQSLDALIEEGREPSGDSGTSIEEASEAHLALAKLKLLDPDDQQIITWRFAEGYRPAEIAAMVGESENTVSVRLHRAVKRLRTLLN
jgi:RNA polymerase sigma-70 factor (ECF subfamily)